MPLLLGHRSQLLLQLLPNDRLVDAPANLRHENTPFAIGSVLYYSNRFPTLYPLNSFPSAGYLVADFPPISPHNPYSWAHNTSFPPPNSPAPPPPPHGRAGTDTPPHAPAASTPCNAYPSNASAPGSSSPPSHPPSPPKSP